MAARTSVDCTPASSDTCVLLVTFATAALYFVSSASTSSATCERRVNNHDGRDA